MRDIHLYAITAKGTLTAFILTYHERTVRDMSIFEAKTLIQYSYRKIRCLYCGIVVEDLGLVDPTVRITKRLANYILDLCGFMTIKEIAKHLSLDWKTVKEIHIKEEKPKLKSLLTLNEALSMVYILKDYLKKLWQYKYAKYAEEFLDYWCCLAEESKIRPVMAFAKTLKRYAYGIINHCKFPIHTSRMEGINNKIKVIKRKAYGFHDVEYFSLIIKGAFAHSN